MANFKIYLKNNKVTLIVIFVIISIISFSFYKYFKDNFMYVDSFYKLEEKCFSEEAEKNKFCSSFSSTEDMKTYFEFNNPKNKFARLDAITLTCEIVENQLFSILQLLAPLLIIISIVGVINKCFNSGMFKNYLMRMNYKDFLKKIIIKVFKISLIIPLSLIFIFLVSCIITKFNFKVAESTKIIAVYNSYKYNNFILYGIVICILQYLTSVTHGMIGLFCAIKNKNPIISAVIAYVMFIIEYLFIYIVFYSIFLNSILGIKGYTDYFNITGYWFFNYNVNYYLLIAIALIIALVNFVFIYIKLFNKERVVIEHEKQIS